MSFFKTSTECLCGHTVGGIKRTQRKTDHYLFPVLRFRSLRFKIRAVKQKPGSREIFMYFKNKYCYILDPLRNKINF